MRTVKYIFILFACCIIGGRGYAQSFYRTYPIPTGSSRISSEGYLLIPADSNRIAVVGELKDPMFGSWDYTFSLLADSLGDTVCSHGDFMPDGAPFDAYGIQGVYSLIETPSGFSFVENNCAIYEEGVGGSTAGVISMNNRMHLEKIDTIYSFMRLSIHDPNLYNSNNNVYFTGTPWAYVDTCACPRIYAPIYTPVWKLNNNGNYLWRDSLYSEIYKSEIFYSIPTANSQIAVLGVAPISSDTLGIKFYDNNGTLITNYKCEALINNFSIYGPRNSTQEELLKLKNNILIIGNDSDLNAHKLQLCIESVDSLGTNRVNLKKYIINNDIENAIPRSVYSVSDSGAFVNYGVTGSNLNYYLSVDYRGDSLGSFVLPGCSNSCYDGGNILCETDTNNTFVVREYTQGGSLVYQYIYSHGPGHCKKIATLPQGKGRFIMTGEVNDTLFVIRQDTDYIHANSISVTNINCNEENNGAINLSIAGGLPPYTYSWNLSVGTSSTLTGLSAGNYTVTITDNNGNSNNVVVAITQPTSLQTTLTFSGSSCSNNKGLVRDSVSGGTPPYTYLWSNGRSTDSIQNLSSGSYICLATDAHGCIKRDSVFVPYGSNVNLSETDIICGGLNTGTAAILVNGNYSYNWSPAVSSSNEALGLSAGTYSVTITNNDTTSCMQTYAVTITQPPLLSVNLHVNTAPCNIAQQIISTVSGGIPPYTYAWTSGGIDSSENFVLYCSSTVTSDSLLVTDSKGCTTTNSVHLTPAIDWISQSVTNVSCNGGTNGAITLQVCGGTAPYTYSWYAGTITSYSPSCTISNLRAGNYLVNVWDSNFCSVGNIFITISQPPALSIITDSTNDNGTCNGSAWVQVSGGTLSYSYLWTGGLTTDTISNQCDGDYCCIVTDANGCIDTTCVIINIVTGTNEVKGKSEKVKIYPNPNDGEFTVVCHSERSEESLPTIQVYNTLGENILTETLRSAQGDNALDLTGEPNGLYLYRVITYNGSLLGEGKFVIQH